MTDDLPEYSVYQFFSLKAGPLAGRNERVRAHVTAEEAVKAARHYTDNVATRLGTVDRVIITDGGDSTVFEWKLGQGVTFPRVTRMVGMSLTNEVQRLRREYARAGWIIDKGGRHWKWRLPGRRDYVLTSVSPSDHWALVKIRHDLRRYAERRPQR